VLITKHFILLHVPKTGGTFLTHLCLEHLPPEWEAREHQWTHGGYDHVPPELESVPALAFVRNPWDWYVSWYHWALEHPPVDACRPGLVWRDMMGSGQHTFKETVIRACSPVQMATAAPAAPPHWLRKMVSADVDYYSALHSLITRADAEDGAVTVRPFEALTEGFLHFLDAHDLQVPESLRAACLELPPVNASQRDPDYRRYYDDDLRNVLYTKASALIDRYGYSY
jgi:hypothetical protein